MYSDVTSVWQLLAMIWPVELALLIFIAGLSWLAERLICPTFSSTFDKRLSRSS